MSIHDLAMALRTQADWLDRHAELLSDDCTMTNRLHVHLYSIGPTKGRQQDALRTLGSFVKQRSGDSLWCTSDILKGIQDSKTVVFLDSRSFCTPVTRTVIRPAQPALPERPETITEWECPDSLLAPEKVAAEVKP